MEKALAHYQAMNNVLAKVILGFAGVVIGLDVLSIFSESLGRYIFGSSRAFMEEFPRLLVPYIVFPMMGVLLYLKRHISVDVLPEKLQGKNRSILMIIVYGVVLAVAIEFMIAGIVAVRYFQRTGLESITEFIFPMWWVYISFPIGFALLILFSLELLLQEFLGLIKIIQSEKRVR